MLIRSDSAGATYGFAAACRDAHVGFSLGCAINAAVRDAAEVLTDGGDWYPRPAWRGRTPSADTFTRETAWRYPSPKESASPLGIMEP